MYSPAVSSQLSQPTRVCVTIVQEASRMLRALPARLQWSGMDRRAPHHALRICHEARTAALLTWVDPRALRLHHLAHQLQVGEPRVYPRRRHLVALDTLGALHQQQRGVLEQLERAHVVELTMIVADIEAKRGG